VCVFKLINASYQCVWSARILNIHPYTCVAQIIEDRKNKGKADIHKIKSIIHKIGFDNVTEQDMENLLEATDLDKDGFIGLSDFRKLLGSV
jgi:hypothetical protein